MNMGTFAFKMPDIGEGVVEGEVVEWMVAVGDTVKEDDPILSVMTDKATVEIPSPVDGTVTKVVGEAGDILPVGVVCIEFEVDGAGNASASDDAPAAKEAPAPAAKESKPEPTPEVAPAPTPAPKAAATPTPAAAVARAPGTKALASPAVRQRAREANISLDHVAGSGPAGRISHADLDAHIAGGASGASRAANGWACSHRTQRNGSHEGHWIAPEDCRFNDCILLKHPSLFLLRRSGCHFPGRTPPTPQRNTARRRTKADLLAVHHAGPRQGACTATRMQRTLR